MATNHFKVEKVKLGKYRALLMNSQTTGLWVESREQGTELYWELLRLANEVHKKSRKLRKKVK